MIQRSCTWCVSETSQNVKHCIGCLVKDYLTHCGSHISQDSLKKKNLSMDTTNNDTFFLHHSDHFCNKVNYTSNIYIAALELLYLKYFLLIGQWVTQSPQHFRMSISGKIPYLSARGWTNHVKLQPSAWFDRLVRSKLHFCLLPGYIFKKSDCIPWMKPLELLSK